MFYCCQIKEVFYFTAQSKKNNKEKKMKVIIGTKNPGKINGALQALEGYYEDIQIQGISAPSEVSDQPVNEETYLGAVNRVKNTMKFAQNQNIDADLFMAVESGLVKKFGHWYITNIAVVSDKFGNFSTGMSASFPVPEKYIQDIKQNTLGTVMDKIFHETDLRSSTGGIGILTHEKITRIDLNKQAFTMALTQFINGKIWRDEKAPKIDSESSLQF